MPQAKASIGIDWGTHSSKWTWTWSESESSKIAEGPYKILRSEVCLEKDVGNKIFLSDEAPQRGSVYVSSIKGKLIKNPDAPFWAGPQKRVRLTLGELVSFSLWFLLGEAYQNLYASVGNRPDEIDVRFSLPNWVDIAEGAVGRACYEQATSVACYLFASDPGAWQAVSRPMREKWQELVQSALKVLDISDDCEIDTDRQGFRSMLQRTHGAAGGVRFRFVAESSAAGLAGLRRTDEEENKYLRKILVVDVGAGSTDIGYVIRSVPPKDVGTSEALCQLPPANTCQIAGEDLSRRIVEIYRSQGRDISLDEAEIIKIAGEDSEWLTHQAVTDWIHGIAEHVRGYVYGIPDRRWLRYLPGLQVLVTGGSGVVAGLREAILSAAADGLRQRGISSSVIGATIPISLALEGPAAQDANRLAVALGAASEDLPRLSYLQKLDPPMQEPTVRVAPSWTG